MLPLLSSFDGMLHEYRPITKYEGGPEPSIEEIGLAKPTPRDAQNGNARTPRARNRKPGADLEGSGTVNPSTTMAHDTFYEAYYNLYKYSNERTMPFVQGHASAGARGDGDISMVEQHLKVFSLQGLRTMGKLCVSLAVLSTIPCLPRGIVALRRIPLAC